MCTATETRLGCTGYPISPAGHDNLQSRQSAIRHLYMRSHANICVAWRMCTHTNKKLASYSAYINKIYVRHLVTKQDAASSCKCPAATRF